MENTPAPQQDSGSPVETPPDGNARGFLLALAILNIVFGLIVLGSPWIAGRAVAVLIGIMLLVSGMVECIHAFSARRERSGITTFLGGFLAVVCGGVIIAYPLFGSAILTLVLTIYFVTDGMVLCIRGFMSRPIPGWGVLLFGGVVSLVLAIMIWRGWPMSGLWTVGVLVGIRIFMSGLTMLILGMAMGRLEKELNAR